MCLKIHSDNLHSPLCGIFGFNSVNVARYASLIGTKSPTKCDAQLAESNFQTHSREKTLYLSDTYARKEEAPMLELCVKVININPEEGHEILNRCGILREYSEFVEILRKHQQTDSSDAYKNAIEECMKAGILADYLKKKGSEVVNMLIAEYDYDLDVEVQREEAYAAGKEDGRQEGQKEILQELVKRKLEKGKSIDIIAEELEESYEEISSIIKKLG